MGKWTDFFGKSDEKTVCPACKKRAVSRQEYRLRGLDAGSSINSALSKHSMNCVVEYQCSACRHTYK